MSITKTVDLHFADGGSDKVYHAILRNDNGGYVVEFAYGRRGSALTYGSKTASPVPPDKAEKIFDKLVSEKVGKGYQYAPGISGQVFADAGSATGVIPAQASALKEKVSTGIYPQLLNPITEDELERLINDSGWCAQEKKDGKRLIVKFDGKTATGINRKSFAVALPPAIIDSVKKLGCSIILDGEAVGDTLHCFGLLELNSKDCRPLSYEESYNLMVETLTHVKGNGLEIVDTTLTPSEKRMLFEKLKSKGQEGIVFKKLNAPYMPNRPASGGDHLKFKFVESASVVVMDVNAGKRSVKMGVYANGSDALTFVGNVTIPPNYDIPQKGDIVEVQYLYAFKGGSLFQPVYQGVRDDIETSACAMDQLKWTNRQAEEEQTETPKTTSSRKR